MNARRQILVMLATTLVFTTGCKSMTSWKLPGSSFWSSNREPDAETLVGQSELPQLPDSPAAKYTPSTIASVGAQTGGMAGATQGGFGSSPATGGTSPYGFAAQTVSSPKAGLAATANGYQTGPYQVSNTQVGASPSAPGTPSTTASNTKPFPNPYGGSYSPGATSAAGTGSGSLVPDVALPNSVNNALGAGSATSPSTYPSTPSYPSTYTKPAGTIKPSASSTNIPVGYSTGGHGTAPATGTASPSVPSYPSAGSTSVPTYPSLPTGNGASAVGTPTAGSTLGAPATTAGSAGFAPGTTGRNTGYNFGTGASTSLPPNTASGAGALLR